MVTRDVWVAVTAIWHGDVRAYSTGDIVPDTNEARWDYSGQGLVRRVTIDDSTAPPTASGRAVAFRDEVVLAANLVISPTPPSDPAVGTVWIDNSTS